MPIPTILPNRAEVMEALDRKVQRVFTHYRRRFVAAFNGNMNSVDHLWQDMSDDVADVVESTIRRIGRETARRFDLDPKAAEPVWMSAAEKRGDFLASRLTRTARTRIRRIRDRVERDGLPERSSEVKELAKSIFGPGRAGVIAQTETVWAENEIGRRLARLAFGPFKLVWQLGPCDHCGFCPEISGTSKAVWGRYTKAPPAHVGCCCWLLIVPPNEPTEPMPGRRKLEKLARRNNVFGH